MSLEKEIKKLIKGKVISDSEILNRYSHDTSIFEIKPQFVIIPKDANDIKSIVKYISKNKKKNPKLSITVRAGGSDMTGGCLSESLILDVKNLSKIKSINSNKLKATVQPGVFYRDFEKIADRKGIMIPTYPASKSLCALGGMVANNAGGEKSIAYGKTQQYVSKLKVILSDGNEYSFSKLSRQDLQKKLRQADFEGKIYNSIFNLIAKNYELISRSKPNITKNSSGYYLWDVYDKKTGSFDLTQLFSGSQGTLGIITEIEFKLVKKKKHSRLIACFLKTTEELSSFVNLVLPHKPESLEAFDDATLKLALKFFPEIAKKLKKSVFSLLWEFRRETLQNIFFGIPKFIVLVELTENNQEKLNEKINKLAGLLREKSIKHVVMNNKKESEKYWIIRRESFNLLRKKVKNKHAAAFIDDFIVLPKHLPEFFPKIEKILKQYGIKTTILGHAGSGNFHIIPLMDLTKKEEREKIHIVSRKVYKLVAKYHGSITAEHNDGLIRSPYLPLIFDREIIKLFEQTKNIFDPRNIFNPGKKVNADIKYAMKHIKTSYD